MDFRRHFDLLFGNKNGCTSRRADLLFDTLSSSSNRLDIQTFHDEIFNHLFTSIPPEGHTLGSLVFRLYDKDNDGFLNKAEFRDCFFSWIVPILCPRNCLIVVDVQNDFIDGTLALRNCPAKEEGCEVVPMINKLLETCDFDLVVYTKDWHPQNHCSFIENVKAQDVHPSSMVSKHQAVAFDKVLLDGEPPVEQQLYPAHCVQNTWGAQFYPELLVDPEAPVVQKGINPKCDCLSGFLDSARKDKTELDAILTKNRITDVFVCGLAFDYCVGSSALDAVDLGYRTTVVRDACRSVDPQKTEKMLRQLEEKGAMLVSSNSVNDILVGVARPVERGNVMDPLFIEKATRALLD